MKESNDVLTKNIDQDELDAITQLVNEQQDLAKKYEDQF